MTLVQTKFSLFQQNCLLSVEMVKKAVTERHFMLDKQKYVKSSPKRWEYACFCFLFIKIPVGGSIWEFKGGALSGPSGGIPLTPFPSYAPEALLLLFGGARFREKKQYGGLAARGTTSPTPQQKEQYGQCQHPSPVFADSELEYLWSQYFNILVISTENSLKYY